MKLSLKFYRKLFRLFCLKRDERQRIEKMYHTLFSSRVKDIYDEYVEARHELSMWEAVAKSFRIGTPYELYNALQGLEPVDNITATQLLAIKRQCAAEFDTRRKQ